MEVERDDGITQAIRCVSAMTGQDHATRLSLWRAALRYAERDRVARSGGREARTGSRAHVCDGGSSDMRLGME